MEWKTSMPQWIELEDDTSSGILKYDSEVKPLTESLTGSNCKFGFGL